MLPRTWVNTPVAVPPSAWQFIMEVDNVPQQVPRFVRGGGTPELVTFAPKVAPVVVMEETVGLVTVGTALQGEVVNETLAP